MFHIDSNTAIYIANAIVIGALYCLVKPLRVSIDNLAERITELTKVSQNNTADIIELKMRVTKIEVAMEHYHSGEKQ